MGPQALHVRASEQHTLYKAASRTIAQGRAKPMHLESQWPWSVTQLAGFAYQLISMVSGMRCEFSRPSSLALLYQRVTPEQPIQMEKSLQSSVSSILQLMEDARECCSMPCTQAEILQGQQKCRSLTSAESQLLSA